jgi:hypothetical protein
MESCAADEAAHDFQRVHQYPARALIPDAFTNARDLPGRDMPVLFRLLRILVRILHMAFGVAELCLSGTDVLVDIALHLLSRAADRLTGDLLDFARRLFDAAFNLIFVNAHE